MIYTAGCAALQPNWLEYTVAGVGVVPVAAATLERSQVAQRELGALACLTRYDVCAAIDRVKNALALNDLCGESRFAWLIITHNETPFV